MPRKRRSEDGLVIPTSPIKIKIEQFIEDRRNEESDTDDTTVNRFAEDTSMLGFRYLHTRYKTWFRILWACVLIFFIGLTVYQVFERITYYFIRNPLTTRRSYETLPKMYFPTIGICNKMQMKASSVAIKNAKLLRAMCNSFNHSNSSSNPLDEFNDVDMLDVHRSSFQSADDLFLSCEFGKSGSCQDDIRPIYTPNGLCFTVSPNKTIHRPGPETTLSLLLNLEVHDIIPGAVVEPGVILSIDDGQSSLSHYTEGIHLEAGKVVTIPVNEVRKLVRYKTTCGALKLDSFDEREYSKAACEWSMNAHQIGAECNCTPIMSPVFRNVLTNDQTINITENIGEMVNAHRRPVCTLRQELECVQERLNIRTHIDNGICPDDCEDISFSSIVFGGKLSPSEIVSLLPSDWEDTKEKRVADYQKALEVIPNEMIPVVRDVQLLADELQSFLDEATQTFGLDEKLSDVKCLSHDGRTFEGFVKLFHSYEPIWERITVYLQSSLARSLNITANCIGLKLMDDGHIVEDEHPRINMSQASLALIQLGEIENSLTRRNFNYGLAMMHEHTRRAVIELARPLIREIRECVTKMYDNPDRVEEIVIDCRLIFKNRYAPLMDASSVYTKTSPSSTLLKGYMDLMKKLTSRLNSLKTRIKMSTWKNFDINLKEFESLYREDGKDHQEIDEMLKLRKAMVSDVPEMANQLSNVLAGITVSRSKFSSLTGTAIDETWNMKFLNASACLRRLYESSPQLKRSRFLRGEWLSRLRNQVLLAQSYSATPQYDAVNLLHIKFYFAHFKQETIVQERSYNMFLLLAEIGGTIGLYVGATLLTVAETLVFFFERKTRNIFLKPKYL